MVKDGKLITPMLTDSVLESITRDSIMCLAKDMGIPVIERTIDRTELYTADEAFLCGSAMEVTPVSSIDKYNFDNHEITNKLHEEYLKAAKHFNSKYYNWVTKIY